MESTSNRLETDFDQKVVSYYYSIYSKASNIIYDRDLVFNKYTLMSQSSNVEGTIDEDQLKQDYDNIVEFLNTFDFKKYPVKNISVEVTTNGGRHIKWLHIYSDNKIVSFDTFKSSIK